MSNPVLRLARAAVLLATLAAPALAGSRPGGNLGSDLTELDEVTALHLVMLDVIELVGTDPDGTDYYASTSTGHVDYYVSGTTTTVRGGDTGGRSGTDVVTGGKKSAS